MRIFYIYLMTSGNRLQTGCWNELKDTLRGTRGWEYTRGGELRGIEVFRERKGFSHKEALHGLLVVVEGKEGI